MAEARERPPTESQPRPDLDESAAPDFDREALRAISQGDSSAFASLVRRHGPPLFALLARLLRDEHAAEDAVQESFVKAWKALSKFDASRPFFPWLRTIGVNTALNEIQRRRRQPVVDDAQEILSRMPAPQSSEERLQRRELVEMVEDELTKLPPEWEAVFRLRVQEELSYAEIAETLQVPMGTVMSRLSRARHSLARALRTRLEPSAIEFGEEEDDD